MTPDIPGPPRLGILVRPPLPTGAPPSSSEPPGLPRRDEPAGSPEPPPAPPPLPARRPFLSRRLQVAGAAAILLLLVGGSLAYLFRSKPVPSPEPTEEIAQAPD